MAVGICAAHRKSQVIVGWLPRGIANGFAHRSRNPACHALLAEAFVTTSPRLEQLRMRFTRHTMRALYGKPAVGEPGPPARLPAVGIHRILVCRSVRTLGDSLTLTPLLEELEARFPGAEIDLLSRCPVAEQLYGKRFAVGRIMRVPTHAAGHIVKTTRTLVAMRQRRYDLVIDPDPQSQSGRAMALLANTRWSLGFAGPLKSGTLTHMVDSAGCPRHMAKAPVYLLRQALGTTILDEPWPCLNMRLDEAELRGGREVLGRLVGRDQPLAPGCTFIEVLPASGASLLGAPRSLALVGCTR